MTKNIEVSDDLYNALQSLKTIFSQLSGEEIKGDEEVLGILVSGFVESLKNENMENIGQEHNCDCGGDCDCEGDCEGDCDCQKQA